jgi:hypothetical protein
MSNQPNTASILLPSIIALFCFGLLQTQADDVESLTYLVQEVSSTFLDVVTSLVTTTGSNMSWTDKGLQHEEEDLAENVKEVHRKCVIFALPYRDVIFPFSDGSDPLLLSSYRGVIMKKVPALDCNYDGPDHGFKGLDLPHKIGFEAIWRAVKLAED